MKVWVKLALIVLVIAALAFLGVRLMGVLLEVVGGIDSFGGAAPTDPVQSAATVTPEPIELDDQDYDAVQGAREY